MTGARQRLPSGPSGRAGTRSLRDSLLELAERFRAHESHGLSARWVVSVADHGSYTIHVHGGDCFVSVGAHEQPDATLRTDIDTWLGLVDGDHDGIAAFTQGRLEVNGDLNLALRLESLFLPAPGAKRYPRTVRTDARGVDVESLVVGRGTPVVLLHGLCASKVSFLPTVDALAEQHEVHALDLPGFGKSAKPLPAGARYSPRWMADVVHGYLRAHGLRQAWVVGNSMGGRIGVELALRHPRRVLGVVGLCPAVAFDEWQWAGPALRYLQGQWLGVAPFPLQRGQVEAAIADMFHDPGCVPAPNLAAAAEEFLRGTREARHRLAILACARHLAGERASGKRSFWRALERLTVPSLWIFGRRDNLVSWRYCERVRERLPDARCEVWDDVGHVPQFEAPQRTNDRIRAFFAEVEAARA